MDKKNKGENTLTYYNTHAAAYTSDTQTVDFTTTQNRFLAKLPSHATILDFGCGSGRDTRYFLSQNHKVTATDGSPELCRIASEYTGIQVKNQLFQDLADIDRYDGIWACSSILHLTEEELLDVLPKMTRALKPNGIIYTSFKYGDFSGLRNDRYFTDMTEAKFAALLSKTGGLTIEDQWVTSDVRPQRGEEKWLNLILRKK